MGTVEKIIRRNARQARKDRRREYAERQAESNRKRYERENALARQRHALHLKMLGMITPLAKIVLEALAERSYRGGELGRFIKSGAEYYLDAEGSAGYVSRYSPIFAQGQGIRRHAYWVLREKTLQTHDTPARRKVVLRVDGALFVEAQIGDLKSFYPVMLTPALYKVLRDFANNLPNVDTTKIVELEQSFDGTVELKKAMGIPHRPRQLTRGKVKLH